jgi:hypothetical protein
MNLIHTTTLEYPRSLWQLRQENPNVSFPAEPTDEDLAPFDHANVHPTPPPECDPRIERVMDTLAPQQADDGTWHQAWVVRPATAEEIAAWDAANAPAPDWAAFKATALGSASLNQILAAAYQAAPVAAGALPLALAQAEAGGNLVDFAAAWAEICAAVAVEPAVIERFQQAARACHLPAAFVAALQPEAAL